MTTATSFGDWVKRRRKALDLFQKDLERDEARWLLGESLALSREMGDMWSIASSLNSAQFGRCRSGRRAGRRRTAGTAA